VVSRSADIGACFKRFGPGRVGRFEQPEGWNSWSIGTSVMVGSAMEDFVTGNGISC